MITANAPLNINAPEGLTAPGREYKRRTWIAFLSLLAFAGFYIGLSGWFVLTAYRQFTTGNVLVAIPTVLPAVFMIKALFFIKRGSMEGLVEIRRAEEPELFAGIDRLADSVKAPRPHRVFLSPDVNAAVAYDLSLINLLLPARKNLIIGLGLVNTLNADQFKAVLAHEFGHFSQRTMTVGRWVYVGRQIAAHMVAARGSLDSFLNVLCRIDLRIAWIGWILSAIIWSIRTVTDSVFRIVLLAERALSREMEFHADLVAVSVTGSDHLVNGLHRMEAASLAWSKTIAVADEHARRKESVEDLYAVQTHIIERMRGALDDPNWGATPPLPATGRESHRIFTDDIDEPLQMWNTHPSHRDRENNAKRIYVAAPAHEADAWSLFSRPSEHRRALTRKVYEGSKCGLLTPLPLQETLAQIDAEYSRESMGPAHRGLFLNRFLFDGVNKRSEIFEPHTLAPESWDMPPTGELAPSVRKLCRLDQEIEALESASITMNPRELRHRGRTLKRGELSTVIGSLRKEADALRKEIAAQGRRRISVYRSAAAQVGGGWEAHLVGVAHVLHYAEQYLLALKERHAAYGRTLQCILGNARVSEAGIETIRLEGFRLYNLMSHIHTQAPSLIPDRAIARRLGQESWTSVLEPFRLEAPTREMMQSWIGAVEGWVISVTNSLEKLRGAALDELLATEARVAEHLRTGEPLEEAPAPSLCPLPLDTPAPEKARKNTAELGLWDRFLGSYRTPYALTRTAVAASFLGLLIHSASVDGEAKAYAAAPASPLVPTANLHLFNGLETEVVVNVDKREFLLAPNSSRVLPVSCHIHRLKARTAAGRPIEDFEADTPHGGNRYIYNVAAAAVMADFEVPYGNVIPRKPFFCSKRWLQTPAEHVFEPPPQSIRTHYTQGELRRVIEGHGDLSPGSHLSLLSPEDATTAILAHARFDLPLARHTIEWLQTAAALPQGKAILKERLLANPHDVPALRLEQDLASPGEWPSVALRHRALAESAPKNPDLRYIAIRASRDDIAAQDEAFIAAHRENPSNLWLANAAGFSLSRQNRFEEALSAYQKALTGKSPIEDYVAMEMARICRLRENPRQSISDLAKKSPMLAQVLSLESPAEDGRATPQVRAYNALYAGAFDNALNLSADTDKEPSPHLLVLIAASDGAPTSIVERALALPATTLKSPEAMLFSSALALRHNRPAEKTLHQFKETLAKGESMLPDILGDIRPGMAVQIMEMRIEKLTLRERGQAYAFGAVALGDAAPKPWRDRAMRLLFATERPRFTLGATPFDLH